MTAKVRPPYDPHYDPTDPTTWHDPREEARQRAIARNGGRRGYQPYAEVADTIRYQPDAATRERMWGEYDRTGHVNAPVPGSGAAEYQRTQPASENREFMIRNPGDPVSEPQVNLLAVLVSKLSRVKPEVADQADQWIQGHYRASTLTKGMAHDAINRLRRHLADDQPAGRPVSPAPVERPRVQVDRYEDVPVGYYALGAEDGQGTVHFYRVTRHEDTGRWYVQEQASDTLYPMRFAQANAVMTAIRAVGWKDAAMRYAELIGRCYKCGRTLTDEESRARGIGPVCAEK